jgi:hypothetical protein
MTQQMHISALALTTVVVAARRAASRRPGSLVEWYVLPDAPELPAGW